MRAHVTAIGWTIAAAAVLLLGGTGSARAASCVNDIDCTANPACGGEVCDYSGSVPTCKPAGTAATGMDGWCSKDSDCKCASLGATCTSNSVYCTFTKPSDAPGATGGGGSGQGGASGTAGASGTDAGTHSGGGGGGGCSIAPSAPSVWQLAFVTVGIALAAAGRRRRRT